MVNLVVPQEPTTPQGAELYSLAAARLLRKIGSPLSASQRTPAQIHAARELEESSADHACRVNEVIALMRARFATEDR